MSSASGNFVANKDTILKEGYFKKRNFKGEIGRGYSRRWCVLSARYFEWYDHPNGQRKQTIPLDHCYTRIHEGTGLIVGSFQNAKEWLLRDEGSSPAATAAEWLEAINKAIENYRNVSGSAAASGSSHKGLVPLSEMLAKGQISGGTPATTVTQTHSASPVGGMAPVTQTQVTSTQMAPNYGGAPMAATTTMYNPAPAAVQRTVTTTAAPVYSPPMMQTTMAPAPMMQTNFGYAAPAPAPTFTTYQQPMYAPATATYVTSAPMVTMQPTFVQQPQMTYVQQPPMVMAPPTMTYTTYNPMF